MAMHISMAIFMAVRNGTVQCAKNFLNVGQHDPFASHESSIKIYRGAIKPNTNKKISCPAITIAFLHSACTSTNRHLLETFFTEICWFELIIQPLKTLPKTPFAKAVQLTRTLVLRNSVILKFKWRKIFEFLSYFKCIVILDEYVNEMSRLQNCFPLTLRRFFLKMAFSNSNLRIFFITLDLSSFLHQKLLFSSLLPHFFFSSISFFLLYYWSSVARTKPNNTDASCL